METDTAVLRGSPPARLPKQEGVLSAAPASSHQTAFLLGIVFSYVMMARFLLLEAGVTF